MRRDKFNYYLDIAETAISRGTCLRRNFGAIIVKNDQIISTGYTGAPRGRKNCCDCGECIREKLNLRRGERYELCRSVHAEANCIISAARNDMIGSTLLNNIVKLLVKRIRPLELMLVDESSYSFPSGHTMAAVSMYGLLIYLIWCSNASKKAKIIATISLLILILLVALSRVYLGAHYASDILGAVVLSLLWLLIITDIFKMKNIK